MKKITILLTVMYITGCSLDSKLDLNKSQENVRARFLQLHTNSSYDASDFTWQQFFKSKELRELIGLALRNNYDLRSAKLGVKAQKALYQIQHSNEWPNVNASSDAGFTRPNSTKETVESYRASVGSAWEIDFVGRLNSLSSQAINQYLSSAYGARAAELSIISAVANAYFQWRASETLFNLTADTLKTYEQSSNLVQKSLDAGVSDAITKAQSDISLYSARSSIESYKQQMQENKNALLRLISAPMPVSIKDGVGLPDDISDLIANVPALLSSEILTRRPDIMQAEHDLLGANANVGAARANFFPKISLTGSYGYSSSDLKDLFKNNNGAWNFSPSISLPIFNAGQLDAQLRSAKYQREIKVQSYENTVQNAFYEVQNVLDARVAFENRIKAQSSLINASKKYQEIANIRYMNGIDSYLTLLDAQRTYFSHQQQTINLRLQQLANEVAIYKALGGGYNNRIK